MYGTLIKITLIALFLVNTAIAGPQFLTLSDIHYGSENTSNDGQDTGPEFFKITMDKIKELSQDSDFILFLGDIPTHAFIFDSAQAEYEKFVFHALYQNDTTAKPMFYIPGNNDSLLGNYQAFESSNGVSPLTYATDWNGACAYCKGLIIDDSHMYHDGYYSSYVIPNNQDIILIVLNATQWTKIPWLKRSLFSRYPNQEHDALIQLKWLKEQLKTHQAKQLLIAMHEPPGNSYLGEPIWYEHYLKQFINIISTYNRQYGQITLLNSHTHMDEFRRIQVAKGVNIYSYSTPSISRNHHNYPGMKIFSMNDDLKIKDFTTFYTSYLYQWQNQQYHALGGSDTIFPGCQNKILAQCMDELTVDQVCDDLDKGLFYGVKSPKVPDKSCRITYPVN